jgi:hypothetical protein
MAIGEVLCEPNKEGAPLVLDYDYNEPDEDDYGSVDSIVEEEPESGSAYQMSPLTVSHNNETLTLEDIERSFLEQQRLQQANTLPVVSNGIERGKASMTPPRHSRSNSQSGVTTQASVELNSFAPSRLDELLARPMETSLNKDKRKSHRRICSASDASASCPSESHHRTPTSLSREGSINKQGSERLLVQVAAYGEISDYQPSLMDQARMRAASSVGGTHRRLPSLPNGRHSRKNSSSDVSSVMLQTSGYHARKTSDASAAMAIADAAAAAMASLTLAEVASAAIANLALPDMSTAGMSYLDSESGALPQDEIERTFTSLQLGARNAHRKAQSRDSSYKYHN